MYYTKVFTKKKILPACIQGSIEYMYEHNFAKRKTLG